jgi:hypothetical protein
VRGRLEKRRSCNAMPPFAHGVDHAVAQRGNGFHWHTPMNTSQRVSRGEMTADPRSYDRMNAERRFGRFATEAPCELIRTDCDDTARACSTIRQYVVRHVGQRCSAISDHGRSRQSSISHDCPPTRI